MLFGFYNFSHHRPLLRLLRPGLDVPQNERDLHDVLNGRHQQVRKLELLASRVPVTPLENGTRKGVKRGRRKRDCERGRREIYHTTERERDREKGGGLWERGEGQDWTQDLVREGKMRNCEREGRREPCYNNGRRDKGGS